MEDIEYLAFIRRQELQKKIAANKEAIKILEANNLSLETEIDSLKQKYPIHPLKTIGK